MLSNTFLGQKLQIWTITKNPTQEKSLAEIIHVGTNDLSGNKEPKDMANDIMQLANSVKTDANKVAVPSILPRKDKLNSKAKELNTHLQDICSTNNLPLITRSNINHAATLM